MTPLEIINRVRYITKSSSTDGVGGESDLLDILNDYYYRQVVIFVNTNEDKFGVKSTTNLNAVANQEAYSLPTDCIRVKRVEVNYDGSDSGWRKARFQDAGQVESYALSPTNINNYYSTSDPYYDLYGDYLRLRPIPLTNITGGLMLWYIQRPSTLNGTSAITTPADFHGYLVYGVAAEVATRQGNDAFAASMLQKWEDGRIKIETMFPPQDLDKQVDFQTYPVDYS